MSRYFIAATDFGPEDNKKYPRWRVYRMSRYREPWGHRPAEAVSGYFWTAEETREELLRLEDAGTVPWWVVALMVALLAVSALLLR